MDWNLILRGVEILAVILVGLIFRLQIKSQGVLIEKIKTYSDIIDIDKLEAYTSSMIKLAQTEAKLDAIKYIKEELYSGRYDEKLKSIDQDQYEEYLSFSLFAYVNSNAEMRSQIKSKFFQKEGHVLDKVALEFDKRS